MADDGGGKGLVAGAAIGFAVSCALVGGGGAFLVAKKSRDVRRGWNLIPVVVAATDIPEGTQITFDMISQRSVPEQFVTSSVVKPSDASFVVNKSVHAPMQAGDPLLWSMFADRWLVAARDVPAGGALGIADLEERSQFPGTKADGCVRVDDRAKLDGHAVVTPLKKGQQICWDHLAK